MTPHARRRVIVPALLAPLAAVPAAAFALMEYGPERSFIFAGYLLVFALAFLVAGVAVARRRPAATAGSVLARAAVWAAATLVVIILVLFALSFVIRPALP
jgi:hypothetical protein